MDEILPDAVLSDKCIRCRRDISQRKDYSGGSEIAYSMLVRACETSDYLFLFQTQNQAFLVDRSTVTGGSFDELRAKLRAVLGDQYSIRSY